MKGKHCSIWVLYDSDAQLTVAYAKRKTLLSDLERRGVKLTKEQDVKLSNCVTVTVRMIDRRLVMTRHKVRVTAQGIADILNEYTV